MKCSVRFSKCQENIFSETWRSQRQTHLISQRAYTIPMCVVGVMDSDPLLTGPPEFHRLKNKIPFIIKSKGKERKAKGEIFHRILLQTRRVLLLLLHCTDSIRTCIYCTQHFHSFSLFFFSSPSFLSFQVEMNFPVFSCTCVWGCSWKKIQKEEEENEEEESLFRWCVESDGALISPHRGPTLPNSEFDWKMRGKRIKESKNKRENTDRARGSSGARGRHGGIEDEKEKKTKMDRLFSLFSVPDVPLLCRSAKCLSHYNPHSLCFSPRCGI